MGRSERMTASDACMSLSASDASTAHSVAAVVFIEAAGGAHGAQGLRQLVVKLAREMPPLLFLPVDESSRKGGRLAHCQLEALPPTG